MEMEMRIDETEGGFETFCDGAVAYTDGYKDAR